MLDENPDIDFGFLAKPFTEQLSEYPMRNRDKEDLGVLYWALGNIHNLYVLKLVTPVELKRIRKNIGIRLNVIVRKLVRMAEHRRKKLGGE